ncbi:GNAT family N-acetyltransferase [Marinomonas sp.]|uniref:GNAT family N-acetyltransferase n=1 Tax=Marinomonas sp. TaxID=1904862 RepID=UPI003BAAB4C8
MDFYAIHAYIAKTYWAEGIPKETFKKTLDNSLCFGFFSIEGKQVGFARMIADQATFVYLADVFIYEAHRGKGYQNGLCKKFMITHHYRVCAEFY